MGRFLGEDLFPSSKKRWVSRKGVRMPHTSKPHLAQDH